ncbi:hypothetical protein JIQ42_02891 [Leishmania sp. Namibia]|uniref:hypothetical protein n=1 Tax=Leishmania sp. Namibia TaxID=2802991 RepID=UPI001B5166DD|nr:hypothetical protein JIQ42_02891 [Leishmania sp. Namibia]
MLVFGSDGFLRPLLVLGVWLFGSTEDEILTVGRRGAQDADTYNSSGSPFARLTPDWGGGGTVGREIWAGKAAKSARTRGERSYRSPSAPEKLPEGGEGSGEGGRQGGAEVTTTRHLDLSALHEILSYRIEGSPLPLALAAAGPRARLAGEKLAVFFFPGAATSLRCDAAKGFSTTRAAKLHRTVAVSSSHESPAFPYLSNPFSGVAASVVDDSHLHYCRVVRGTSLEGISAAMRKAAWWYGRPTASSPADRGLEASSCLPGEGVHEEANSVVTGARMDTDATGSSILDGLPSTADYRSCCVPLCVEVIAARLNLPSAAARKGRANGSALVRLWRRVQTLVRAVLRLPRCGGGAATSELVPVHPAEVQLQRATAEFVAMMDQLWRLRRCALVELLIEGCPVGVTEWILSPERRSPAAALHAAESPEYATQSNGAEAARLLRAFQHMRVLRCCGSVSRGSMVKGDAGAAAGCGASSGALWATSGPLRHGHHPSSPAAAVGAVLSLSLTAVRPHLRLLDLFNNTTLSSLDGIEGLVALEKIVLTRCSQLYNLSPLGLAPSLRDIVASQSGIFELTGLALSRTLVSLSLYGCLNLTDVSACGSIPTLRDMFISESTVRVLDGLRESRSLARLGMRYCDVRLLTALSPVSSLTILHASSSTLTSVVAL